MRAGLMVIAISICIAGCSITGLGDSSSKYDCKAPPGISCDSLSGVYANAVADNLPGSKKKAKTKVGSNKRNAVVGEAPQTGLPVLSEPKVLRVWVAPWEDNKKVLHDQTFLYAVADPGHWQVAHTTQKIENQYRVFAPAAKQNDAKAGAQPATPAFQAPQAEPAAQQNTPVAN